MRPSLVATKRLHPSAILQKVAEQLLAPPAAVHVGGVEKRHARLRRRVEDTEGRAVVEFAPVRSAKLPAAQAHFRDLPAGSVEQSFFHAGKECENYFPNLYAGNRGAAPSKKLAAGIAGDVSTAAPWRKTVCSPPRAARRRPARPVRLPRCVPPPAARPDRPPGARNPSRA